jgi:MFS transporter, UMF1 family
MQQSKPKFVRGAFSWAMYDWANSAFATTIMAGFFPIFFGSYWSSGEKATTSTFWLGISLSISGVIVAVMAPIIGAIGDRSSARKKLLLIFATIGIFATGGLYFVSKGMWPMAATCYVVALVSWLNANSLYDSLLVNVSHDDSVDFLSGFGFALGYIGGGLLFVVNVLMTLNPAMFGLIDKSVQDLMGVIEKQTPVDLAAFQALAAGLPEQFAAYKAWVSNATKLSPNLWQPLDAAMDSAKATAVQISFLSVAVWWAVFSIPLIIFVKETEARESLTTRAAIRDGFSQFLKTAREILTHKNILLFLLAYWFYIDGVDTVIGMAVDFGKKVGFKTADLITALLLVQFVGFPFTLLFAWLGQKFHPRPLIFFALFVYMLVTALAYNIDDQPLRLFGMNIPKFFLLAFLIGMVQGCIQSMSRSFFARLVPEHKAGSYFGFYNMMGKFATIFGPLLIGITTRVTENQRLGFVSVSVLFVLGALLLTRVKPGHELH